MLYTVEQHIMFYKLIICMNLDVLVSAVQLSD